MNELPTDLAEARRRFDEACATLRPDLHRFTTRMMGDPCEGEDVLQEALVLAFYRLPELRDAGSLRSWLFRIAHNKCIDMLRVRRKSEPLDEQSPDDEDRVMEDDLDAKRRAELALEGIVSELPAKERACVVLKDLLECSLEETAEITQSNVGAVKAALHRGREKLVRRDSTRPARNVPMEPRRKALVARYLAAFNARDWTGVRSLLAEEARLEVVHRSEGPFASDTYFVNYSRLPTWRLELAWVDGVECVVHYREIEGQWKPHSVVQLIVEGDRVAVVRDYVHVEYMLAHSAVKP